MILGWTHQSILLLGLEDYIHMGNFLFRLVKEKYPGDKPYSDWAEDESLRVISDLLQAGLIEAVVPKWDKTDAEIREIKARSSKDNLRETYRQIGQPKFVPWMLSTEETIERIRREWEALGRQPDAGDIVWFQLTPLGKRVARQIEERNDETLSPIEWPFELKD